MYDREIVKWMVMLESKSYSNLQITMNTKNRQQSSFAAPNSSTTMDFQHTCWRLKILKLSNERNRKDSGWRKMIRFTSSNESPSMVTEMVSQRASRLSFTRVLKLINLSMCRHRSWGDLTLKWLGACRHLLIHRWITLSYRRWTRGL